jgi:hypothetical protein
MMGTKKVGILSSPQKRTIPYISKKIRVCKEHKLKGIKILDRIKSEGKEK